MDKRKLVESNVRLYKSCSDLSIRRFDMIYKTQDLRYLCLGYDGYDDIEVPNEAEERWKSIFDEWIELCDDNKISYYYQLVLEVTYLQTRYFVSEEMLKQIWTRYPDSMDEETLDMYIVELGKWKYKYNKKNSSLEEVNRLMLQHKASSNKLSIKKSELKEMQDEHGDGDAQTLEKQAVILEQITGKNNIDVDTISVLKWLEIGKLASSINEQRRKNVK